MTLTFVTQLADIFFYKSGELTDPQSIQWLAPRWQCWVVSRQWGHSLNWCHMPSHSLVPQGPRPQRGQHLWGEDTRTRVRYVGWKESQHAFNWTQAWCQCHLRQTGRRCVQWSHPWWRPGGCRAPHHPWPGEAVWAGLFLHPPTSPQTYWVSAAYLWIKWAVSDVKLPII